MTFILCFALTLLMMLATLLFCSISISSLYSGSGSSLAFLQFIMELNAQAKYGLLLFALAVCALAALASFIINSSNHFIISLEISAAFNALIIIMFHNLKIANTTPVI